MSHVLTSIENFFTWWKAGLLLPFKTLLDRTEPIVLRMENGQLLDQRDQIINDYDSQAKKTGVYLLASRELVLSKRINDLQIGLPLEQIVKEILPFDTQELIFTADQQQSHIYAVLKSDLGPESNLAKDHGFRIIGTAFELEGRQMLFKHADSEEPEEQKNGFLKSQSAIYAGLVLILVAALSYTGQYAVQSHGEQQTKLKQELQTLKTKTKALESRLSTSFSAELEIRNALHVSSQLNSLATSLTDSTQLRQIILSRDDLIIDAQADSATQLLSRVDAKDEFASSEFVSSISRNTNDQQERFRLKIQLGGFDRKSRDLP